MYWYEIVSRERVGRLYPVGHACPHPLTMDYKIMAHFLNFRSRSRGILGIAAASLLAQAMVSLAAPSGQSQPPRIESPTAVKQPVKARNVQFRPVRFAGQDALQVSLSDEEQARQRAGSGANSPTYLTLADGVSEGTIEVDIAAVINGRGGPESRGFAGIAFNINGNIAQVATGEENFEMVYLRMANGLLNDPAPPPPRNVRAIQYGAYPDFDFSVSRQKAPGVYESAANVASGRWHKLRIDLCGSKITGWVDGKIVLNVESIRTVPRKGVVGIWVGDGTDAYISNFKAVPGKC